VRPDNRWFYYEEKFDFKWAILIIFAAASLIRPAPAESPQGRKAARVGGRSGAM
jgi:hypothetical protein